MAINRNNFLRGVLGPLVFKKLKGKQVVCQRMIPGTMRQSEATKLWSNTFGMASTFTSQVKQALGFSKESYVDTDMTNRLSSAMVKILKECRDKDTRLYHFQKDSFSGLTGFNFNIQSPVRSLIESLPELDFVPGVSEIYFPNASFVKFPKKSARCKITIRLTLFRLMDGLMSSVADQQSITVLNDKKNAPIEPLYFIIPNGCLCLVTMFLEYAGAGNNDWKILNDVNFNPCCILGAEIIPGTYQSDDSKLWSPMIRFNG